jgi:hypothetical protein
METWLGPGGGRPRFHRHVNQGWGLSGCSPCLPPAGVGAATLPTRKTNEAHCPAGRLENRPPTASGDEKGWPGGGMSWLFGYEVGLWSTMHAGLPIRVSHGAPAVTGTHRWLGRPLTRKGSGTYFWRHPIAARPHRGHQPTVWVPGHWRNPPDLRLLGTQAHHNHLTLTTALDRHRPKQTTTSTLCIPNLGLSL